jgi:WD40 repeat protein
MPLSCDQARLLLSDLLAGVLEPADADQLDAHLAQCESCREHARSYCRLHRALGELTATAYLAEIESAIRTQLASEPQAADPINEPVRSDRIHAVLPVDVSATDPINRVTTNAPPATHHAPRITRRLLAAAALLLAMGVAWWLSRPASAPVIARLERIEGEVYVVSGASREAVAAGRELRSGQGLQTVGEESGAVVVYPDATRLEIGPDSTVGELSNGGAEPGVGKRVALLAGFLGADVTKQPEGRPMVLTTPHARVVVQGTRFSLVNSPEATRVDLEQGSVRLTRRSDGESVEMAAGTFSIARGQPEPQEPLGPLPLPAQYAKPRLSLPAAAQRIWTLTFSTDGGTLVTGGSGGEVRLWDPMGSSDQAPIVLGEHPQDELRAFAFSRDGRLLASSGDNHSQVKVWDWGERKEIATLQGHRTWIEALAFSQDGRTLVVAGAHGEQSKQIQLWDLERRQVRTILDGHVGGVWCVTFSPDGQTLASAGRDGVIKLWDFAKAEVRRQLTGHTSEIYALAFSPDGRKLVSSSRDKTVKIWDTATGQELRCLLGHSREVRAVAFAPDGRSVASGGQDNTLRLWRVADGLELATFKLPGSAFAVAYSPDGRTLAAGGWYKTVQLFDLPADTPAR